MGLAHAARFASSSCSFPALSATRSPFTNGATLISALPFMFASTNLAIEVAALPFIFLGWQYVVALSVGAPMVVAVMAVLVMLTMPERLTRAAREHAEHAQGMDMNPSEGPPDAPDGRSLDHRAWHLYIAESRMVWTELLIGLLIAGAIAATATLQTFEQAG